MTNERLTDERLKYADEDFDAYFAKPAETQKLVRELVAEIDALRQERHTLRNELTAARLENERLRAKLGSIRARCLNLAQWIDNGGDPERSATEASFIALLAKEPSGRTEPGSR